jgi:uncharacterized protein
MKMLHPGARWSFRIGIYFVLLFLIIFSEIYFLTKTASFGSFGIRVIIYLLFIIIFAEIYARMSYSRWYYEFNDSGLKLERGIIWKRYSNIPYERIQNVDIHRGILARMLGYSTVMIQTAGYSARAMSEGNLPAVSVEESEKIRTSLMKKITSK